MKKRTYLRKMVAMAAAVFVLATSTGCGSTSEPAATEDVADNQTVENNVDAEEESIFDISDSNSDEEGEESDSAKSEAEAKNELDNLSESAKAFKKIFCKVTKKSTPKQVRKLVKKYKLEYIDGSDNDSYDLEAEDDNGNALEFEFDGEDGTLNYCSCNINMHEALFYIKGTYWDFRKDGMDGDYSGYYSKKDSFGEEDGIEVKYDNGRSAKTYYKKRESAEDAFEKMFED